jgi:hypothetical protein
MTMKTRKELACPKCSHKQEVMVWSTVNSMDKEASQLVRDMKLKGTSENLERMAQVLIVLGRQGATQGSYP